MGTDGRHIEELSDAAFLRLLAEIARTTSSSLEMPEVFGAIAASLRPLAGFVRTSIAIISADGATMAGYVSEEGETRVLPEVPVPPRFAPLLEGLCSVQELDLADYPAGLAKELGERGVRRAVNLALRSRGRVLAVLNYGYREDTPRSPVELERLSAIADHVAPAVANALLHDWGLRSEAQLGQVQKLDAVGQLAGGIAHDFNNLLTVIRTHASLLERAAGDPERVRHNARAIQTAAARAGTLTDQLLAFGRRRVVKLEWFEVDGAVQTARKLIHDAVGESIEVEIRTGAPGANVHADVAAFEQVVVNLAANAREAMPEGGRLTLETSEKEGDVVLTVTDTGCGMDEPTRARAFEPFFTTKDAGMGSGLGLATAYGIVQQSGGAIELHSAPGRGTRCEVRLPRASGETRRRRASSPLPPVSAREQVAILLVEDERLVREATAYVLEDSGFRVLTAENGERALEVFAIEEAAIDAVITDVVMPGMSGRVLATRLRERRPSLPILFITGYARDEVFEGDEDDVLIKPYDPDELLAAVRGLLGRSAMTTAPE